MISMSWPWLLYAELQGHVERFIHHYAEEKSYLWINKKKWKSKQKIRKVLWS